MTPRSTAPKVHYTEQPSALRGVLSGCGGTLFIEGGGFLTPTMVEEALSLASSASGILVDLREVSGYDADCVRRAEEWLTVARRHGVRRIAFIASSIVFRTAALLVARRTTIDVRTFEHEPEARRWLTEAPSS